mmetsp:Transcript_66731/g.132243  ORF Transcript_66731/g.132243 Transcript_66731/m.132243 type:complete len:169 (-) Transcript_66731:107-613(-)
MVLRRSNATRVFLQTSTPTAVDLFEKWTAERNIKLAYTANPRSTHDLWVVGSGRHSANHSGERTSVVAQSVNAFIASRSRHFISPSSSMWTYFVRALMGKRIGDKISDSGSEAYEGCIAERLEREVGQVRVGEARLNATLGDRKLCKKSMPKLIDYHRRPKQGFHELD